MKNLLLILILFLVSGCKKDAEKILLKNDNSWQFQGEIKTYQEERLIATNVFKYEILFKNETSGTYRVLNTNDPFKNFTCKFYSGFMVGKKLDMYIYDLAPLGYYFHIDKVKKNKIQLSATSSNAFDFLSASHTPTTEKITAEMIKL